MGQYLRSDESLGTTCSKFNGKHCLLNRTPGPKVVGQSKIQTVSESSLTYCKSSANTGTQLIANCILVDVGNLRTFLMLAYCESQLNTTKNFVSNNVYQICKTFVSLPSPNPAGYRVNTNELARRPKTSHWTTHIKQAKIYENSATNRVVSLKRSPNNLSYLFSCE